MKAVLLFLLALILPVSAHTYIVKAKVVDETDSLATGAVAPICTTDTAAFITAPIDEEGLFTISYSKKGNYIVKVQLTGYEAFTGPITLENDSDLGVIKLRRHDTVPTETPALSTSPFEVDFLHMIFYGHFPGRRPVFQ